ncbi:DUF11 domain-containing protein [Diaphorobacter sp. HDW4B]|uniref:IPTL-CTERM sorting domain-containing protein n=1 Tax=Diaphorobacter sp. HDW4B TaxID=2714925 RepID=UPI0014091A34|nr:IPTL-CTERM sorting domain-containing protein [Diaphorobacter sp. HDW4B]QIL73606.1 DUF11 domain-containing protein [Diaphorobacter sp. HDW4B]
MKLGRCWRVLGLGNAFFGWLLLAGVLLLSGQAHAQGSVAVDAPISATGGDNITIPVSMSTVITTSGNSTFNITVDGSLLNVAAVCNAASSSANACAQVSGVVSNGSTVTGTISNLAQGQVVVINVTARVPTESTYTGYANPGSIATIGSLQLPNNSTSSSQGNTTVTYLPYNINYSGAITSPSTTFSFGTDEIVMVNTYTNTGPGLADGIFITGGMETRDTVNWASSPWVLTDKSITCTESNGAQCPTSFDTSGDSWWGKTAIYQARVPTMPVGGQVVVTVRFKIAQPAVGSVQCTASWQSAQVRQAKIRDITGLGHYIDSLTEEQPFPPQLVTAPVPVPACPETDLETQVVTQPPVDLQLNTTYDYEIVFRNNGPLTVDSYTESAFSNHIINPSIQVTATPWQCTATGGATCPDSSGVITAFPPGGEVRMRMTVSLAQTTTPTCGTSPSWFGRLFVSPGQYTNSIDPVTGLIIADSNPANDVGRSTDSNLNLPRPACPVRDIGATVDVIPAAVQFGTPYVVRMTYTNYGPSDMNWPGGPDGPVDLDVRMGGNTGSTATLFASAQLSCTASGGATCPALTQPSYYQQPFSGSWWTYQFGQSFGVNNAFSLPTGGALTYQLTLMPIGYVPNTCPNGGTAPLAVRVGISSLDGAVDPANDPHLNGDTKESVTAPVCEDLTINKQLLVNGVQTNAVDVNGDLSFNLTASAPPTSQGGQPVTSVLIEDILPTGFVFDPATAGQFACTIVPAGDTVTQCATLGNGITWDAQTRSLKINTSMMNAGASVTYAIVGKAENQAGVWTNTATLKLNDNSFYDPNPVSNTSNVEFTVNGIEPTVLKSTLDPVLPVAGANVRYNLSISNPVSGDAVINGSLSDTLPAGFTLVSASTPVVSGGASFDEVQTPQAGATTLNWSALTMPPGSSVSVDIVVKSNPQLTCGPAIIHNSATFDYFVGAAARTVTYDGPAPGHPREDVTFPCVPVAYGTLAVSMNVYGPQPPNGFSPEAGLFATCTDIRNGSVTRFPTSGYVTLNQSQSAIFSNIPDTLQCVVAVDPSKPITTPPPGYGWMSNTPVFYTNPFTIVAGQTANGSAEWTLVNSLAALTVDLTVTGGPAGFIATVPVSALCDQPAVNTAYPSTGTENASTQQPAVISAIPEGAVCQVQPGSLPTAPTGYAWQSPTVTVAPTSVTIASGGSSAHLRAVLVADSTNTGTGSLTVTFMPTGLPAGYNPVVQASAMCDLPAAGTPFPASGTLAVAAQGSNSVASIPVDAHCVVSVDAALLPAAPAGYQWQGSPVVTQPNAITTSGVTAAITWVMVPIQIGGNTGSLSISFVATGAPVGYTPTVQTYAICSLPTAGTRYPGSGTLGVQAQGSAGVLQSIPVGAQCVVSVDMAQLPAAPTGYQWQANPVVTQPNGITANGVTATIFWTMVSTNAGQAMPVPSLGQWALILLSLALAGFAATSLRRSRTH